MARAQGRLQVYLGVAAGVGKTTRLLEDAHALRRRGVDVVVGIAAARGRPAVEARLHGLEVVPARAVGHRGVATLELDVDAVLARRPGAVIVDDLAHVNAPGSPRPRRHEDALVLQRAGIDVRSALDVAHLRSLSDRVQRAGVSVRETVPGVFLEEVDALLALDGALEDLPLSFGTSAEAWRALRELMLHEVAGRALAAPGAAPEGQRVMVCLSDSPLRTAALLRRGARLAGRAHWFAVRVQRPGGAAAATSEDAALARSLGAEVVTLTGDDVAAALVDFARSHAVGPLVLGRAEGRWRWPWASSVTARLLREATDFDLQLVAARDGGAP